LDETAGVESSLKKMKVVAFEPDDSVRKSAGGEAKTETVAINEAAQRNSNSKLDKTCGATKGHCPQTTAVLQKEMALSAENTPSSLPRVRTPDCSDCDGIVCLDVEVVSDGAFSQFSQIGAVLSMGGQCSSFGAQVGQ
jgi:hypothetical protein